MSINKRQQLPVGTIVKLSDESIDVAIIGQLPVIDNDSEKGYYDFVGVILPVGYDAEKLLFFNKEDIKRIVFLGYINLDFQQFQREAEKFEKMTEMTKLSVFNKKRIENES